MRAAALLCVALTLAGAVAGCMGGPVDRRAPISVTNGGAPGGPGPYVFRANIASEAGYVWSFGDGPDGASGATANHTYRVRDGNFTVRLTTREGEP